MAAAVAGSFVDVGQPLEGNPELIADGGVVPSDDAHTVLFETIRDQFEPVVTAAP